MPDVKPIPFARREHLLGLLREAGRYPMDLDRVASLRGICAARILETQPSLPSLLAGINAFEEKSAGILDPVLAAACVGFGYALAQPQSGLFGPAARYLFRRALTARGFGPSKVILPVSTMVHHRLDDYRHLYAGSEGLAAAGCRGFFDATAHAAFFYECLQAVIDQFIPQTISYIERFTRFHEIAVTKFGFPERPLAMLFERLHANDGRLPERLYAGRFPCVTLVQARQLEAAYPRTSFAIE
jgi:hypothetical protein